MSHYRPTHSELQAAHLSFVDNDLSKQKLVEVLLNDQSYHIEFNGHLTNHNKHAVIALSGLGASQERIKSFYDNYAIRTPYGYSLETAKMSKHVITQDNWQLYLGKRTSFSSYCQFFDQQEKELGMDELLKRYVPILLPGWAGAFTHATIHLGWALDANSRWMTIEGLAYQAFSYVSCHPEKTFSAMLGGSTHPSILDSLLHIAGLWERDPFEFHNWVETLCSEKNCNMSDGIHPELVRSGLQYRIAKLLTEGHPLIYTSSAWIEDQDISTIWEQLYYAIALLYLAQPGDFVILHLITALHAMEQIAIRMPAKQQKYAVKCFWIGMLCILFSRGEFPKKTALEALNSTYKNSVDAGGIPYEKPEWEETITRAISEEEEHNPKMVYVLRRRWELSGYRSIFRIAATHFTTTPELPKSFETPPTE